MKLIVSNPHLCYVNTRMHRPSVVDDDASAPEGYWHPVEPVAEPERPSSLIGMKLALWTVVGVAVIAAAAVFLP